MDRPGLKTIFGHKLPSTIESAPFYKQNARSQKYRINLERWQSDFGRAKRARRARARMVRVNALVDQCTRNFGEVAERLNALVLKTSKGL